MSRLTVSLKTRVRYEGLARTLDRRANQADLEKLPDPIWYVVGQVLRSKFRKPILTRRVRPVKAAVKSAVARPQVAAAKAEVLV